MPKKLSDDVVKQLRNEYAEARENMVDGETIGAIDEAYARQYGLTRVSVAKITSGQTYKNSPGPRVPRPGRGRATVAKDTVVRLTRLRVTDDLGNVLHDAEYAGNVRITTTPTTRTTETETTKETA